MKTSILIYATCFIVTGCTAQLRFPSLSSALSSLTGFGSQSAASQTSSSSNSQPGQSSSPYSGLVRDYGRNLMMAMSSIYPTLFKPPQQPQQQSQPAPTFDQQFSASQFGNQGLFSSQSVPSFSIGGSTFSISPSLPFGLGSGGGGNSGPSNGAGMQPQASGSSHSPFSASFGSSINSPSSFGPLSSGPFFPQSMPSFAPASSYNAAFEAANGGANGIGNGLGNASPFGSLSAQGAGAPSQGLHSSAQSQAALAAMSAQPSNQSPVNSFATMSQFAGQPDGSLGQQQSPAQQHSQQQHQQQSMSQQPSNIVSHSASPFGQQQQNQPSGQQYASQSQYRPDVMSIAASAPVPTSNSYSNYGSMQQGPSMPQGPGSQGAYQQPSYR